MQKLLLIVLSFIVLQLSGQNTKYSPKDLLKWESLGRGNGFVTHGQFVMEETEGSKGFMIVSPQKFDDVILRYEVMTLNPATVLVAILNASDIGESGNIKFKDDSDCFSFWTGKVEDYMFAFRVQAHNSTPFLRKHPAGEGQGSTLAVAEKDMMHSGWRHQVECGKKNKHLWLKIDGKTILDHKDDQPLGAGKIAIRVRGTANELGKCMVRNLEIEGRPLK